MEGTTAVAISSSPSSSSAAIFDDSQSTSGDGPSRFLSVTSVEEERESGAAIDESPENVSHQTSTSYNVVPVMESRVGASSQPPMDLPSDDTLSCVIVILTFWFFVSMTLIMGIFGSEDLELGPYSSILLKANPLFVSYLKMETSEDSNAAPVVYGLYNPPLLDVTKMWSQSRSTSIKPESHREWVHYLNEGSQVNISYNLPSSSSLILVIAQGIEGLAEWVEDPLYPDSALSWNVIRGNGTIRQDIIKSYDYYIAVGNFNSDNVEVGLNFSIRSTMYGIADSYYKCNLTRGVCNYKILFPKGNLAVLTTPGPLEGAGSDEVYVKLSYEPRWMTYFLGIGIMTSIMLWTFNFLNKIRRNNSEVTRGNQRGSFQPERAPLLPEKDDDLSSLGSSYDSGSQNDDDYQDYLEEGLSEGRSVGEGGKKYNSKQLCVICYDAPKDCFFIPCGHCATCFSCGVRAAEISGTCPICRRRMKKVRRIYNV